MELKFLTLGKRDLITIKITKIPPINNKEKIRGNQQDPEQNHIKVKERELKKIIKIMIRGREEEVRIKKKKKKKMILIIVFLSFKASTLDVED